MIYCTAVQVHIPALHPKHINSFLLDYTLSAPPAPALLLTGLYNTGMSAGGSLAQPRVREYHIYHSTGSYTALLARIARGPNLTSSRRGEGNKEYNHRTLRVSCLDNDHVLLPPTMAPTFPSPVLNFLHFARPATPSQTRMPINTIPCHTIS